MSKQRCLTCDQIKGIHCFTGRLLVCNDCKDGKTQKSTPKKQKDTSNVSTVKKASIPKKRNGIIKENIEPVQRIKRPKIVHTSTAKMTSKTKIEWAWRVLDFAEDNQILKFMIYEEMVDLSQLSHGELCDAYTLDELKHIYKELESYVENPDENQSYIIEASADVINQLDLIEKYKDGALPKENTNQEKKDAWRQSLPSFVKAYTPNWRNASVEEVYGQLKDKLTQLSGAKHSELFNFICEFSQVVYEQKDEYEEANDEVTFSDDVAESIYKIVEMIVLPHVEVLDRLKDSGGNIKFADIWNEPFTEALKKEVKDRDSWKCVICEDDVQLHVHHKIPRNLGGINHKDNLVTLCASCHGAIETADVPKAYKKCLANFRRKKLMGSNTKNFSNDKTLLKQEVEENLDKMLETLIAKDETVLIEQLSDVMKRLEIIFYD